jgi:Putative peptidoglycan binding domain
MTLAMPDSITPANLPPGYPAYLGYVDGLWPTAAELRKRFPAAHVVSLTVTGGTLGADGIDCEPGNPGAASSADWIARKLAAGAVRPLVYASVIGSPGYGMPDVLRELGARGIARSRVRLLSAHYGIGKHVCGPASCNAISTAMDGTQWTDTFAGVGGSEIDMSVVLDTFFDRAPKPPKPPPSDWTGEIMNQLPVLAQGSTGTHVRTVQFQCGEKGRPVTIDGVFGPETASAVVAVQQSRHLVADGVVGPQTWSVLLGVA